MISSVSLRWFNMSKILEQQIARLKVAHEKTNSVVSFYELSDQLSQPKVGPLAYEGVVLKDNISTKGMLTTASSNILENYVPVYDATIVKKLKAAGAVFLAKTTLDELAMGGTGLSGSQGATFNPYDQRHQAGGSSGGSAALAGSRVVNYAIGSDTGDSVRKPA
ncbi:MAG TPA: Asp-tRNA(Asn)/Glu-tRNA(Gln) amidotransferase subunit GatA, partial [Erysipelothrix sp.]|nr:Asp-tRNA(Asn)/Glu-tRNA(Gln) amidotransferase subunit GatA [Erysipelothrix sp.]